MSEGGDFFVGRLLLVLSVLLLGKLMMNALL